MLAAAIALSAGLGLSRFWHDQPQSMARTAEDSVLDRPILALDGTVRHLREWQGKHLMLNFWATWCAPCVAEMPLIQSLWEAHRGENLEVIGIAIDELGSVTEFRERLSIDYPLMVVVDDPIEMLRGFGDESGALPHSVMLGVSGEILDTHTGPLTKAQLEAFVQPYLSQ